MRDHRHDPILIEQQKSSKFKLEKWSVIEESINTLKFRVQWLHLEDFNSAYFYANMKNRGAQQGRLTFSKGVASDTACWKILQNIYTKTMYKAICKTK